MAAARAGPSPGDRATAWDAGRSLTAEQAVTEALAEDASVL